MLELKVGQEIDGKVIDKITMNEDTRDITVWFNQDHLASDADCFIIKANESIETILNHKWEN